MVLGGGTHPDDVFLEHRRRLFGIAYRMLGTVADADDVLQDAWVRWREREGAEVNNVGAYLTRVVTNLSIDTLRRLQRVRSDYPGPWLPQPIVEEFGTSEAEGEAMTDLAQTLSVALLAMLENVPPNERATFVLREAFEMSFDEIAQCLEANPATCRQWSKRARDRLRGLDWKNAASGVERGLLERFASAMSAGDFDAVVTLLHPEVVLVSDGGGKVAAATRPLHGVRAVSRFLAGVGARVAGRVTGRPARVNGEWGGLVFIDGKLDSVYCIRATGERIGSIYLLRNPDKLGLIAQHG